MGLGGRIAGTTSALYHACPAATTDASRRAQPRCAAGAGRYTEAAHSFRSALRDRPMEQAGITASGADWRPDCRRRKTFLRDRQIP